MGVIRGAQGGLAPLILKISAEKGCFHCCDWEKLSYTDFGPPRKILQWPRLGKHPSDAHVCG